MWSSLGDYREQPSLAQTETIPIEALYTFDIKPIDMGFFLTVSYGGGHEGPHHNFVVAPRVMKFGTGVKLDVFCTMVTKKFMTSLLFCHYDVITCILTDAKA